MPEKNKMTGTLIWITGLAGSGKTTMAKALTKAIKNQSIKSILIDGDTVRELFGNDLGYTMGDRLKNAYRIARLCHWLTGQGFWVICATVSLFHEIHEYNRKMNKNYYEVLLETDESILLSRNQKNLYEASAAQVMGKDQNAELPKNPHHRCKSHDDLDLKTNLEAILSLIFN